MKKSTEFLIVVMLAILVTIVLIKLNSGREAKIQPKLQPTATNMTDSDNAPVIQNQAMQVQKTNANEFKVRSGLSFAGGHKLQ